MTRFTQDVPRQIVRSLALAGTVLLLACATSASRRPPQAIDTAHLADVRTAIRAAYERYITAFAAGDAIGVAAVYDAQLGARFEADGRVIQGRAAITASLEQFLRQVGPVQVELHTDNVWLLDGHAYEAGIWSYTFTPQGRPRQSIRGHYVTVWLPQPDGSWKMGADMSVPGT